MLSSRSLTATAKTAGAVLARQPASADNDKPATLSPTQQTAPAEREHEVEAVVVGKQTYVLYQKEVRTAGSSAWLANNPGNMDYTPELVAWGAYEGKSLPWGQHRFAIFPDEGTGLVAVQKFLRTHQGMRDIKLMMNMFAPAGDLKNDPDKYAKRSGCRSEGSCDDTGEGYERRATCNVCRHNQGSRGVEAGNDIRPGRRLAATRDSGPLAARARLMG